VPLALAAALAILATAAAAKPPAPIDYTLTPQMQDGGLTALGVTLTLRANASGTTILDLPDESDGHRERWRFISDIVAEGASIREDGPTKRVLTSKPGARITVRYRVHSAYAQDPDGAEGNPYAGAVVRPTWFSGLGEFVFVEPEGQEHAPATFHWGALRKGWVAASDLDTAGKTLTVADVLNSTMLGGEDIKLYTRPIPGGELRVATRGAWSVSHAELVDDLAAVISAQRRFWGDGVGPYFVSAIPLHTAPDHISVGGTGRFAGFALYGTSNAKKTQLRRTLAHEHTHNWIPLRQGRFPDGDQEPSAYWYTEGFTDFYTDRTLLRSGIWTVQDFVGHLNEVLRSYDTSPVREAPASRIVSDFWTNPAIYALSYQRGYLLAFLWDSEMQLLADRTVSAER